MSGARKALKVISIIMIVMAILNAAAGLMVVFGASFVVGQEFASIDDITVDVGAALQAVGVMAVVSGIVSVLVGILGVRGANNPAKMGRSRFLPASGWCCASPSSSCILPPIRWRRMASAARSRLSCRSSSCALRSRWLPRNKQHFLLRRPKIRHLRVLV